MKKTRQEKITDIEEVIAKRKEELAKYEAALAAEKRKQRDEQIKKIDGICSKGNVSIDDIIKLAETVISSGVSIDEIITLIDAPKTTADIKGE